MPNDMNAAPKPDPWPAPSFLTLDWLAAHSRFTSSDRKGIGQILRFKGNPRREEEFLPFLHARLAEPAANAAIMNKLSGDKAVERTPRGILIEEIIEACEASGGLKYAGIWSNDRAWTHILAAERRAAEPGLDASRKKRLNDLADALAWMTAQAAAHATSPANDIFHITAYFLMGRAHFNPDWQSWAEMYTRRVGKQGDNRVLPSRANRLPECGLFTDAWLHDNLCNNPGGHVALLGAIPRELVREAAPDGSLDRWTDCFRLAMRHPSTAAGALKICPSADRSGVEDIIFPHPYRDQWAAYEVCEDYRAELLEKCRPEQAEDYARAAWINACLSINMEDTMDPQAKEMLLAAAEKLGRQDLRDAVGQMERIAEGDETASSVSASASAIPEQDLVPGARWRAALEDLRSMASSIEGTPDIEAADRLVLLAKKARSAARAMADAERERQANNERIGALLDAIKKRAAGLQHEETALVRSAVERFAPPQALDQAELLDRIAAIMEAIAARDEALTKALDEQATDAVARKRLARLVVDASRAIEDEVQQSGILELLERTSAHQPAAPSSEPPPAIAVEPSAAAKQPPAQEAETAPSIIEPVPAPISSAPEAPPAQPAARAELSPQPPQPTEAISPAVREEPRRPKPFIKPVPPQPDETPVEVDQLEQESERAWGILMERDEPGLAWHLASCLARIEKLPDAMPRPDFLEALCFGRTVLLSGDPSANEMKDRLALAVKSPEDVSEAMLAMAGLIRPALLAPETGAREWAIDINAGKAPFMHRLQQALVKVQRSNVFLTVSTLRRPAAEKDRVQRAEAAKKRLKEWFEEAPKRRIAFHRADVVWKHLFRRDKQIGRPVEAALAGDLASAASGMRDFIKSYNGDIAAIDVLIDRIDDEEARQPARDPIEARARIRLREMIQGVCQEFEHWLDASVARQDARGDETRIAALRDELEGAAKEAADGARQLGQDSEDPFERGAAAALADAMDDLLAAISPTGAGLRERDPHGLLHDGFLRMPGVLFGGDRKPEPYDPSAITDAILAYAHPGPKMTWEDAFKARLAEHSHIASQRCLAILEARGVPRAELDKLAAEREADIQQARHDLLRTRADLRRELDQALAIDAIRNASVATLLEEIEAIDPTHLPIDLTEPGATAPIADFPAARAALSQVKRGLAKAFTDAIGRLLTRMNAAKETGKLTPEDEKTIRSRISRGDHSSASEMLEMVEEGGSGLSRRTERPFNEFFPAACEAIAADQRSLKEAASACEHGRAAGSLDFSKLTEPQARADAARVIQDWMQIKSPQRPDKRDALKGVLGAIGLRNVVIKGQGTGDSKRVVFDVEADPIVNARICPIPRFGSMNHGHWRISLWTGDATPEELVADTPKSGGQAELAILVRRLGVDARRKLAQVTRRDGKSLIVLDEALLLWLLTRADYRLPLFFDCALPFSWCDPYPSTEGPVPPESFYGRTEEIDRIIDPFGSCLVFGGRQLGKSSLLAHVTSLIHRLPDGQVALRLDLKSVGADGRPETVWGAISDELQRIGVLKTRHASAQDFIDALTRWLATDPKRRILLMLDEMDDFLVADGERGYENVVKMRQLMDATQRRCKFVLAGLHNVQRASATANTPLVHFGLDPICVGPFDHGSDKLAARHMVTNPLAAAGYEFADPWLPLRVLSSLSYYPSLAGVFCKQLSERMTRAAASGMRAGTDGRAGPPWFITAKDIDETLTGEEARSKIKWRFDITLDLDQRYKLVALILALRADADAERGLAQVPVEIQDIRTDALGWWPEGFAGRSGIEAFQALLEEMQGLGVVAKAGQGWKLRSARIGLMIGRRQQIEAELLTFRDRQPPPLKWEPGLDRARLSGRRRSPLNRLQEGEIKGLREGKPGETMKDGKRAWIVFGSEAGGIDDVPEALDSVESSIRLERLTEPANKVDAESFGWVINRKGDEGKPRLFWVGPSYAWDESWVQQALTSAKAKRGGIKVVFGGGPKHALKWALKGRAFGSDQRLGIAATQPSLGGALRFWLKDVGFEALDLVGNIPLIEAATGGFSRNLETLALEIANQGGSSLRDVIDSWFSRTEANRMLAMIGVEPGMRAFLEELASMPAGFGWGDMIALGELFDPHLMEGGKKRPIGPEAAMEWAEAMGLAFRAGAKAPAQPGASAQPAAGKAVAAKEIEATWKPNPVLSRLLGKPAQKAQHG